MTSTSHCHIRHRELSETARKRMLQSEYDMIRDIRTSLHIARLGPRGGKDFREKVTTESSRRDFEQSFAEPKAFKWFTKSLADVRKTPTRRNRRRGNSRSGRGNNRYRSRGRGGRSNRRTRYNQVPYRRSGSRSGSGQQRGASRSNSSSTPTQPPATSNNNQQRF